ncbi:MAG: hypothetical protein ACK5U7_07925 [Bacteroidota bacterium]|jgi:hypothetical protein
MYKLEEVFHRHELQNIITGNESVKVGEVIQAIAGFFGRKKEAIPAAEREQYSKR